jgi:hypothetical protein
MFEIIGSRGFPIMIVICVVAMVWLWTEDGGSRSVRGVSLEERLKGYASLSAGGPKICEPSASEVHQILLGTLKKVEFKNSILLTVLIFLEAAALAAWSDQSFREPESVQMSAMLLAAFGLFPSLIAGLLGIRQLDTQDLRGRGISNHFELQEQLRSDLMADLERKERLFRFSQYSTMVALCFLFTSLTLPVLLNVNP